MGQPISLFNLVIAFAAGTLTFFAGCFVPMVPTYIGFLTGIRAEDAKQDMLAYRLKALTVSLLFVLGFVSVFVILGLTFQSLGRLFGTYRPWIRTAGGVALAALGFHMAGIIRIPAFNRTVGIRTGNLIHGSSLTGAFLLGAVFALTWTPCIGPVLASILFWSSQADTAREGVLLLLVFGIGLGMPFIVIGVMVDLLFDRIRRFDRFAPVIGRIAGVILIVTGILFAVGKFGIFSGFFMNIFGSLSGSLMLH